MREKDLLQKPSKKLFGQYKEITMRKYRDTLFVLLFMVGFILLFEFIAINWVLGCETWDSSLWTAQNSCMTPAQLFGFN
tara:strand:+ start:59 stop:295 length:237 start_codon:yes stop_codon:yes gene_type:complete